MTREEKHTFIRIEEDIKAGNIPAVVLLHGNEEFLVNYYAEKLIAEYVNKGSEALDLLVIDRNDVQPETLAEAVDTLPLMSDRKVIHLPYFIDAKGKFPDHFNKRTELKDELAKCIADIGKLSKNDKLNKSGKLNKNSNEDTTSLLIITIPKQKDNKTNGEIKKSPLYKAITKAGSAYNFTALDNAQVQSFIEKRLLLSGKNYKRGIIKQIISATGYGEKGIDYGLFALENDIKKIIAHCGSSDEITTNDVMSVITMSPEHDVFKMIDAISKNRKDEAFKLLHNLLEDDGNVFQLLALITKQLEIMLCASEMKDKGMKLQQIQAELKKSDNVHEYRTKVALETGSRFRRSHLREVLKAAYEIEINIKTGLMPDRLALEYFIGGI